MGRLSWDKWKKTRRKTGRVGGSRGVEERILEPTVPMCMFSHSVVSDSATLWTMALQAPLSTEFSRQEYKNGLPFTSPGDLPDPGIEPTSPEFPALVTGTTVPPGKPLKSRVCVWVFSCFSCVQLFATVWTEACQAPCPWNFPGTNSVVGCHFFL